MSIVIANRQRAKKINTKLLRHITAAAIAELEITEINLGIHLVEAEEMAGVNWKFLQHEGPTDVITFDHSEVKRKKIKPANHVHGELFVCITVAVLQAKIFSTNWQSEIVRYIIHGLLHLLGHDDLRAPALRKMKREENRLVRLLAKRFALAQLASPAKLGA